MACRQWDRVLGLVLAVSLTIALPARGAEPAPVEPTTTVPAVDPEVPGKPRVPLRNLSAAATTAPDPTPEGLLARRDSGAADKPHRPLYRSWVFWTVTAVLVVGTAAITYAVTRPPPSPYYGNVFPTLIPLP